MSERQGLPSEVQDAGAGLDGARAAAVGGHGGPGRGRGGITGVARATRMAPSTIRRGLREVETGDQLAPGRIRRPGGGRQRTLDKDPTRWRDLEGLVEPTAAGDPQSPLRWTAKSVRQLAATLQGMGRSRGGAVVHEIIGGA